LIGNLPQTGGALNAQLTGAVDQGGYWNEKIQFESLVGERCALQTLQGTGTVSLTSSLPMNVGSIRPGASARFTLSLRLSGTVQQFRLTENGIVKSSIGAPLTFSWAETVNP
jgi:hypothetical protein